MQAALPVILAALRHAPAMHIWLCGWACTPAVAQAAAEALAPAFAAGYRATMDGLTAPLTEELAGMVRGCAPLRFSLRLDGPLTDELLGTVLQLGEQVSSLWVSSLQLLSDQHANKPWPWVELTIDTLDIADLCKLPSPRSIGKLLVINVTRLESGQTVTRVRRMHLLHLVIRLSMQSCQPVLCFTRCLVSTTNTVTVYSMVSLHVSFQCPSLREMR